MAIEVEVVTTALVERLRGQEQDPELAVLVQPTIDELHALLGTSTYGGITGKAASIFHARWLTTYRSPTQATKFVPPFVAYREGPIVQRERYIEVPTYRLFVYDEPDRGYWSINLILPLLRRALTEPPLRVVSGAVIANAEITGVSGATNDPTLSLATRYLTISMDTTWY
jgi:hypothetical protein